MAVNKKRVRAFAPASTGNVSVGFDVLGAAMAPIDGSLLGDEVFVEEASGDAFELEVQGAFADKLPSDPEENIVTTCYKTFKQKLAEKGVQIPAVKMTLNKHLPIGSGLGSSACSVVAAIAGLDGYFDNALSEQEKLLLVGELEGLISGSVHYDNVAPCLVGGLQLMTGLDDNVCIDIPVFDDWYWVLCYSGISVSTSAARDLLPNQYDKATTIKFGQQLACFISASHSGDKSLAAKMLVDIIAEPYRKSLLPAFDKARDYSNSQGALAFGISGSGPTVFAVTDKLEKAHNIQQWLNDHYIQNELGFSQICKIDSRGTQVSED